MIYLGAIIAVQVIILVAWLLMKKVNPQGALLVPGLLMIALSLVLGLHALDGDGGEYRERGLRPVQGGA